MQLALSRAIARATNVVKSLQHRQQIVEILQATNVSFMDLRTVLASQCLRHSLIMHTFPRGRNTVQTYFGCANSVPNTIVDVPLFSPRDSNMSRLMLP